MGNIQGLHKRSVYKSKMYLNKKRWMLTDEITQHIRKLENQHKLSPNKEINKEELDIEYATLSRVSCSLKWYSP